MIRYYETNIEDFTNESLKDLSNNGYFIYYTQRHEVDDSIILTLNRHYSNTYGTVIICNKNLNMTWVKYKNKRHECFAYFEEQLKNATQVDSYDMV